MQTHPARTAIRVFAIFALGYFLSYLIRGINLPLATVLSDSLHLSAAQLGLLTSLYLLAFALCQLPLGLLLDRFGPRRVQAALLLIAALGALLSSQAEGFGWLMIGRVLFGIGTSGCLMAGLTAIITWFAPDRLTVLNGLLYAIGGLGAAMTGAPVALLLDWLDWRGVFLVVAAVVGAASVLLWVAVPERRAAAAFSAGTPQRAGLAGIGIVLRSRRFWQAAPLATISQGMYLSAQGLWAGPFLRDVNGLSDQATAGVVTLMGWAMVVGALLLGWVARRLELRGIPLHTSAGVGMLAFMGVQLLIVLNVPLPAWLLWLLFGFNGTAGILVYASITRQFPAELAGRANTTLNLLVFGGAFLVQSGFGLLLDQWPHAAGHYDPAAHRAAWWIALALQAVASVWYWQPGRRQPSELSTGEAARASDSATSRAAASRSAVRSASSITG